MAVPGANNGHDNVYIFCCRGGSTTFASRAWFEGLPDEPFERLARLAARVVRASGSLISLLDGDRPRIKGLTGIAERWASSWQLRGFAVRSDACRW